MVGVNFVMDSEMFMCPCNPMRTYANSVSFHKHKKSNRHLAYEMTNEVNHLRVKLAQQEIMISILQDTIACLKCSESK